MLRWNPFGKVDMEIGSFIEKSPFNKTYGEKEYTGEKNTIEYSNSDVTFIKLK